MMRGIPIVDTEQMRALDRAAIEEDGIPSLVLMERAGYGVFQRIAEWFAPIAGKRVVVLTGKGNNGGDGMVVARYLHEAGAQVHLWLAHSPDEFRGDAAVQWRILQAYGIPALPLPDAPDPALFRDEDLLVDALLRHRVAGRGARTVSHAYRCDEPRRSPHRGGGHPLRVGCGHGARVGYRHTSHLHCDDGVAQARLFPECRSALRGQMGCRADRGSAVAPYSPPKRGAPREQPRCAVDVALLAARCAQGASGACAGGGWLAGHGGRTALAGISALRIGAGLATVAVPASIQPQVASFYPELMTLPLPDGGTGALTRDGVRYLREQWARFDVLALGPGLGQLEPTGAALLELLEQWSQRERPLVIDADGLNWLARLSGELPLPSRTVLTPHPGEAARLLQIETHQVQADRPSAATLLQERYRATIVLKGAYSLVTDGSGLWIVPFAEPSLATGGSGDVLTGAIAGLLAQGLPPLEASLAGAYLHAAAGAHLVRRGLRAFSADTLSRALMEAHHLLQDTPTAAAERYPESPAD
jgi:hydroxyethylthiazole kinase-like uncharacterized protein yjeF